MDATQVARWPLPHRLRGGHLTTDGFRASGAQHPVEHGDTDNHWLYRAKGAGVKFRRIFPEVKRDMKKVTERKALAAGVAKVLKRLHYPLDVILYCVCGGMWLTR